ncbi:hypothetical protein OROMI_007985 [Orobanche minor]
MESSNRERSKRRRKTDKQNIRLDSNAFTNTSGQTDFCAYILESSSAVNNSTSCYNCVTSGSLDKFEVPTVLESSLLVAPAFRTGQHKTHSDCFIKDQTNSPGFGSRMGLQSVSKSNLTSNKLQYFTNSSCEIMNSTQVHSNIPEEELPSMKRSIQRRNYTLKHNSLSFKCSDSTTPQIIGDSTTEIEKNLNDYCEILEGHTAGLGGYTGISRS